jgi:hypothetical protein
MRRPAELSEPQFRMVAVRLAEGAVVALLATCALEMWGGYRISRQAPNPVTGEPGAGTFSWHRLMEGLTFFNFRGPISLLMASALLVGLAAFLAVRGPVTNGGVLRWEVAALGVLTAAFTVFHLVAGVLWLATMPSDPASPFGSRLQQMGSLGWPLASSLLLTLFFLWWVRLADLRGDAEVDAGAAGSRTADADEVDERVGPRDQEAMADAVARVEQLDPVERLERPQPLSADGGTPNGYDEFFRRR